MLNRIELIGRIGQEIQVREMNNGGKVATFSLATSEKWTKNGEKQERTSWHNICIFNEHLVKIAEQYLRKGSLIYISGAMQYRQYEKDGHKVNVSEVVLQKFKGELTKLDSRSEAASAGGYNQAPLNEPQGKSDFDDTIPF